MIVVIGAGVNGLACAVELARGGKKVTVLEARAEAGGLAARRTFGGGFSVPGVRHDTSEIRPAFVDTLGLQAHGLKLRDKAPTVTAIDNVASEKDRKALVELKQFTTKLAPVIDALLAKTAPPLLPADFGDAFDMGRLGLKLRGLGRDDMLELLRVAPMCVADWLRELFETETLSAALAFSAVAGDFVGPWSAGTSATFILQQAMAQPGVVGGPAAVVDALVKALQAHGGTLRTNAKVAKINVRDEAVTGVTLDGGETIAATTVIVCSHAKTALLDLLPRGALLLADRQAAENIRCRASVAKVHLGLKSAPAFTEEKVLTATHLDDLERAFDAVKYRRVADKPALEAWLVPGEKPVVSIVAFGVPYEAEDKALVEKNVIRALEAAVPGVSALVAASETLLPRDLEKEYGARGGSIHHVERSLDQMLFMRPARPFARARTPIAGLYLGSSGCHPGPGVTLAPGVLAARAVQ